MQDANNIKQIIEQKLVSPYFQGIIDFGTQEFFAFEALVRATPTLPDCTPEQLFALAEDQDYLAELDTLCITNAINSFKQQSLPGLLFVNILPINLARVIESLNLNNSHCPLQELFLKFRKTSITKF